MLIVSAQDQAEDCVVGELMNIQRAKSNIRQIRLATSIARIFVLIILSVYVSGSSRRLVAILIIAQILIRKLILGIQHLILVHDARALLQIWKCLLMLAAVDVENWSVEVEVFLVKYIFFIIISFLVSVFLAILVVGTGVLVQFIWIAAANFVVQSFDFSVIQLTDVIVVVLLLVVRSLLLDSESQVIFSATFWIFSLNSILIFSSSNCSNLINLRPMCTRYYLTVLVLNWWLVDNSR